MNKEPMDNNVTISAEQADSMRQECNKRIELSTAMNNLFLNKDFMTLFKYYTEEEPIRLTGLLGDPAINMGDKKDKFREDIYENLNSISRFKFYCMNTIYMLAEQSKKTLDDLDKAVIQ